MTDTAPKRPLSITIISILFIVGSLGNIFTLGKLKFPISILGIYIFGWFSYLYTGLISVASFFTGVGLWRLHERARRIAIGLRSWEMLNIILVYTIPASRAKLSELLVQKGFSPLDANSVIGGLIGGIMGIALQLWFLIKRRRAFVHRG